MFVDIIWIIFNRNASTANMIGPIIFYDIDERKVPIVNMSLTKSFPDKGKNILVF